jgi:hypothetical protein
MVRPGPIDRLAGEVSDREMALRRDAERSHIVASFALADKQVGGF